MGRPRDLDSRFERSATERARWTKWILPTLFIVIAAAVFIGRLRAGTSVLPAMFGALLLAGGPVGVAWFSQRRRQG